MLFLELHLNNYTQDIERIKSLLSYAVMDSPAEEYYDTLNSLVSTICNTPIALISFIDNRRQWYKSKIGMDITELPVEESICQYTLSEPDILEITDTLEDIRLSKNSFVQAENGIRFYAGVPLRSKDGHAIGSVCAADFKPQYLSEMQRQALRDVGKLVMINLEAKRQNERMEKELKSMLSEKIEEAEKQLQIQDKVYNNLLRAISQSNAMAEFSIDGTILSLNQSFTALFGYEQEELIGQNHALLLPESNQEEQQAFWKKLASGEPYSGKFQRKTKSGNLIWIQASYSPVIDTEGNISRITHLLVDITNDVLSVNALEELSRQKDHFIANVSHELRSPIHAILGFSDLLLEQEENSVRYRQLLAIKTAGDSLLYLVNGILDLSKIESGIFRFDSAAFKLEEIIENVFSILQVKADKKQIHFEYKLSPAIPEVVVGDKYRLSQVLINLLDNALKFTEHGTVKLVVSLEHKDTEKVSMEFTVSDTGIGIPPNKLESIFERFAQAEENTYEKYGGSGLGLNICKLLVEKQGGNIFARSTENKGTEFIFNLSFGISENNEADNSLYPSKAYGNVEAKILMCEDNEMNRFLARQSFLETKFELDIAEDGAAGVTLFKQKNYDLVLMDIQMPEMNGYETTRVIREELQSSVPIIALSAHFLFKEKEKCLDIGMNDYLSKPFRKAELFEKIAYWLSHTPIQPEPVNGNFSLDLLREASGGDSDFEKIMLELFLTDSGEAMQRILHAYEQEDFAQIAKEAHKLRSSFGMLGMDLSVLNNLEQQSETNYLTKNIQLLENQLKINHKKIEGLLKKNT